LEDSAALLVLECLLLGLRRKETSVCLQAEKEGRKELWRMIDSSTGARRRSKNRMQDHM
jgi:hypothetical protein